MTLKPQELMQRFGFVIFSLLDLAAILSGLAYAAALFLSIIKGWPGNASIANWGPSELAIRYCYGFIRRGLLGEISWVITGSLGRQDLYVMVLTFLTAVLCVALGLCLGWLLVKRCGWRLGLLILAAPAGWPVFMVHQDVVFRKDSLQVIIGFFLCLVLRYLLDARKLIQQFLAWSVLAFVEVVGVFIHEPFAFLILPPLAIAIWWRRSHVLTAMLSILPGMAAAVLIILRKGSLGDVLCLQADLQRLGLLADHEAASFSIMELARSVPMASTLAMNSAEIKWSVVYLLFMSLGAVLSYYTLLSSCYCDDSRYLALTRALSLWSFQCLMASPVFLIAVDYGRWVAMMFCSGMFMICSGLPFARGWPRRLNDLNLQMPRFGLACIALFIIPSHCCTYSPNTFLAFMPYVAASQWKHLVFSG